MRGQNGVYRPRKREELFFEKPINAGVNALLDTLAPDDLPADLGWNEMGTYYRALLAAQRVKIDFASMLGTLWDEVWGGDILKSWESVSPDDLIDYASPHPSRVWESRSFWRSFNRKGWALWTGVYADVTKSGLYVLVGLYTAKDNFVWDTAPEGFERLEDNEEYRQEIPAEITPDGTANLEVLTTARNSALTWVQKVTT